jgi:hypothetical protein
VPSHDWALHFACVAAESGRGPSKCRPAPIIATRPLVAGVNSNSINIHQLWS